MAAKSQLAVDRNYRPVRGFTGRDLIGLMALSASIFLPAAMLVSGHFLQQVPIFVIPEIVFFAVGTTWLVSYALRPYTESSNLPEGN